MDDAIYSYNFNLNSIRIVWKEVLIRSQANYVYPKKTEYMVKYRTLYYCSLPANPLDTCFTLSC